MKQADILFPEGLYDFIVCPLLKWRYGGNSWEKMAMILFWESVLPFSSLSGTWDWC